MNFQFTPEQELLRKAAREFAEEMVAPRVEEMEKTDEAPLDLYPAMGEAGFLGVLIPQEYGGTGLGSLASMLIVEEIARVSAALAMSLQCLYLGIAAVVQSGSPCLKQKYLPGLAKGTYLAIGALTEPTGGSDPTAMTTTAVREGDYWVINGRKCFITNNKLGNTAWVVARTKDEPRKEFTAFFVDSTMPGFRAGRMEQKIGFHGCENGDLIFQNCRVPHENVLGEEGRGLAVAMRAVGQAGRIGMTGVSLGIMQAALDAAVKFANERVLYGKPIANLQAIQFKIADMYNLLQASRMLGYRAAWLVDQGTVRDADVACCKSFTVESAIKVATTAMEIMGGYGCLKEYQVERYLRDAQMLPASAGTTDIMKIIVARSALTGK